jgi:hypothetical protein
MSRIHTDYVFSVPPFVLNSPPKNWFVTLLHSAGLPGWSPLIFLPSNFRHKSQITCQGPQCKAGPLSGCLVLGIACDRLCVQNMCMAKKLSSIGFAVPSGAIRRRRQSHGYAVYPWEWWRCSRTRFVFLGCVRLH